MTRPMIPSPASVMLAIALAAALLAGCAGGGGAADDIEIPTLDTTEMQPPVRRAIDEAREAVTRSRDDSEIWGQYGNVLFAHKLYEPAAVCYGAAGALAPDNFFWAYRLALAEDLRGGDDDRVVQLFDEAVALQPNPYPPLYQRHGDALVRLGRLDAARDAYTTAVEIDPALAISHRSLGQTYLQLGQLAAAVEHLEQAALLRGEDRIVHASLAQAYTRAGDTERAKQHQELAAVYEPVTSFPDLFIYQVESMAVDSESLRARSNKAFQEGRYADAIQDLEMLVEVVPDSASTLARLGSAYNRTGRADEAVAQLERAVEIEPRMINGHLLLARILHDGGGTELARKHYDAAIEINPEHEGIFSRRALAMAMQGDMAGADQEFARHAALSDPDAEIEHNWGTVLLRKGDAAVAVEHFELALQLRPDHPESLYNLGVSLGIAGRADEAIVVLEKLVAGADLDGQRTRMLADAARQQIDQLRYGVSGP